MSSIGRTWSFPPLAYFCTVTQCGFEAFFTFVAEHRRIYRIVQEAEQVAPEAFFAYYQTISQGYVRGLSEAMDEGETRQIDPEAISYALMGIGHFVAMRWLVWPPDNEASEDQPRALPENIFTAVMDLITHGLAPDAATSSIVKSSSRQSS